MLLKKTDWENSTFVTSRAKADFPSIKNDSGEILPEIAVAGRSNVGKSTLLNDLFCSKTLVKTSSTPGKTQLLNFFTVNNKISFVDLPGYGFAKVPMEVRKEWGPMIQEYLTHRESLQLILFLFDIRRLPVDEDLHLMEWIAQANKGVILILTKADKLKANEKKSQTEKILTSFGVENLHYIHYSVPGKEGRNVLIHMLNEALS